MSDQAKTPGAMVLVPRELHERLVSATKLARGEGSQTQRDAELLLAEQTTESGDYDYRSDLQCYFGLSYASWLTIPRVLMQAMPPDWQKRMAVLLHEYDDAIQNPPNFSTSVNVSQDGKRVKTPAWLNNYRHPDREMIAAVFGTPDTPTYLACCFCDLATTREDIASNDSACPHCSRHLDMDEEPYAQ